MNKKIAIFSIHSDPLARLGSRENGGQNLYTKSLVQNLDKNGWSVDVFTRLNDRSKKTISKIGKNSRVIRLAGGSPSHIPKGNLHPLFPVIYDNFLKFINNESSYDLFHGHHYDGGWMAVKAGEQFKKPIITTFHSIGKVRQQTQTFFLGKTTEEQILEERYLIEKDIINKSSAIIELSESEKKYIIELYNSPPEKIHVIPGGVIASDFKLIPRERARDIIHIPNESFTILFVGRLEWRKGVATLLHATRLLKENIPNIKTVIVGGKIFGSKFNIDDRKEYERLEKNALEIQKLQKEDFKFVGSVSHSDLYKYYSAANVLVIPSYYEPFGLVALEGLISKIPVVASRVGGLKITIQDEKTGLLFEPRNPTDLAEKIKKLYTHPDIAKKIVNEGYADVVKNYSWDKIVDEIQKIYLACLEQKND